MAREPYLIGRPAGGTPGILPQGVAPAAEWKSPTVSYLQGLGVSALSGITELAGVTLPGAREFQRENPVMGFASSMAGMAVPYLGWYGTAGKVRPFMKLVNTIGTLEKSPFLVGAAREAAFLAPFEVGRVGLSQAVGTESFPDMATEATVNLALSGTIGGVIKSVAAAGKRAPREVIPGLDLAAPPPLQIREMKRMVVGKTLTPEQSGYAVNKIKDMELKARSETAPRKRYVGEVEKNPALTRLLNSFFDVKRQSGVIKKRMFWSSSESGFESEKAWKDAAKWNYLDPDNFPETGRFFREITFEQTGATKKRLADLKADIEAVLEGRADPEAVKKYQERVLKKDAAVNKAAVVDRELRAGMQSMGFGWLLGKEENGLFIMAKKTRGRFGKAKVDDRWVLFKTDKPGLYLPKHLKWKEVVEEANSWQKGAHVADDYGSMGNVPKEAWERFSTEVYEELHQPGRIMKLLPQNLTKGSSEYVKTMGETVRQYLAPTVAQFRKNPLANKINKVETLSYAVADMRTHALVFGTTLPGKSNLFLESVTAPMVDTSVPSIDSILKGLSESEVGDLILKLRNKLVPPEQYQALVAAGEISAPTADAALKLEMLATATELEKAKLAEALGETFKSRNLGDLGLPMKWEWDTRIGLAGADGQIVTVVAAKTKKGTQQLADRLMKENPELHIAQQMDISKFPAPNAQETAALMTRANIAPEIMSTIGNRGNTKNLRGFKWDYEAPNHKELLYDFQQAYNNKFRHQVDRAIEDLLTTPKGLVADMDPVTYNILVARSKDLRGEQGAFSKQQNQVVDRVLAPMGFGPNSASRIVQETNTGLSIWHLGMGNVAHPIMNVFTFMTNVVPEVAMVLGGALKDLSNYTFFLAGGTRGPVGSLAFLSPAKILVNSFRAMANPDEALQRGINKAGMMAVTQPRVAEEYVGLNATRVSDLKAALASPGGFGTWLKELAIWLPANSERLSRVHAFTTGWVVGRDVLGMVDEDQLFQWAAEFTQKTMFGYTTADRPRIFTGPIGSSAGLFKTWMMNYMTAMLEYTGQAAKGNWAPLAWQTAGTAAMGGVAATPIYWVADGFSKAFTDKTTLQHAYDNLSEGPADALMFGMPAALTGISMYSQSTSPFANPARDASMMWSSVLFDRMVALSKGVGLAFDNWQVTGQHPGNSRAVRDQIIRSLAPSTVARAVAAFSGEDVIRSMVSGYPMISSVPFTDRALYALKLNPVELDRAMAVADELYRDRAKATAAIASAGMALAEAWDNRQYREASEILKQTMSWGLDPSRVIDSAVRRQGLAREPLLERTFKPQVLAPHRNVLGQ